MTERTRSTEIDKRTHTLELLQAVHGTVRFESTDWIDWLYDANPLGAALEGNYNADGRRLAHLAFIRQHWADADQVHEFMMVVNAATASESATPRFSRLVVRNASRAVEAHGMVVVYGVTNAASSLPTKRFGARLFAPLPVVVARPGLPRGVESQVVDHTMLAGDAFRDAVDSVVPPSGAGLRQVWSPATLAWRLSAPGAVYGFHVSDDLLAISTSTSWHGVPVGVLLKLLPRHTSVPAQRVRAMVGAVQRHHRAPGVVYSGFNHVAPVSGIGVPERLRPAALNLFVAGADRVAPTVGQPDRADEALTNDQVEFDAYELLDFDSF